MSCCDHCKDSENLFGEKTARKELKRYRKRGPMKSTRLLIEAIRKQVGSADSLLDIGGGIGAIQHALLNDGVRRAVHADASHAYLEASQAEAARQGHADRVTYQFGDFVEIAEELEQADIVTLDRVVCCYPDMDRLIAASAGKAMQLYGLVYPRERWGTRLATSLGNMYFRLRGSAFRTYLHSGEVMDTVLRRLGFSQTTYAETFLWRVVTYKRDRTTDV